MIPQTIDPAQANKETPIQEDFRAIEFSGVFGRRDAGISGLTFAWHGGIWGGFTIADDDQAVTNSATNYMVVAVADGAVTWATSTTNWNNSTDYRRCYRVVAAGGVITTIDDYRGGPGGSHFGGGAGGGVSFAPLDTEAGSSRTIEPADAGSYIRFTGTGAKTCTFDDGEGYSADEEYHITNRAASGNLTLVESTGMTLNPPKGGTLVLEPGDTVTVKMIASDEADVFGSTEDL